MNAPVKTIDSRAMRTHAGEAVRLLKALANERRLMVLCMLVDGEHTVGELNDKVDLSQSALSQHLAILREDGLVATRRDGQNIWYRIADDGAHRVIETLHDLYCGPIRGR